jgi:hypothetical protein
MVYSQNIDNKAVSDIDEKSPGGCRGFLSLCLLVYQTEAILLEHAWNFVWARLDWGFAFFGCFRGLTREFWAKLAWILVGFCQAIDFI